MKVWRLSWGDLMFNGGELSTPKNEGKTSRSWRPFATFFGSLKQVDRGPGEMCLLDFEARDGKKRKAHPNTGDGNGEGRTDGHVRAGIPVGPPPHPLNRGKQRLSHGAS